MKLVLQTFLFVFFINSTSFAQCPETIQEQGNNNAQTVILTFNDLSGNAIATCTCNIAGQSGNLTCSNTCPYDVPGTGFSTITYYEPPDNNCLYSSGGVLISVLPIELISFSAEVKYKYVEVKWVTASEINNKYFVLEKTKDGTSYEEVARLDGAGNSTSVKNYTTTDKQPFVGTSYYRLKLISNDNKLSFSNLLPINYSTSFDFNLNVYPNPNDGNNINIQLSGGEDSEILVVVNDILGKQYYSKVIVTGESGANVFALDPSEKLAVGIYMITATANDNIISKKLIVQ
jgi:Secretion system C-terminal sorting domain